MKRYTAPRQLRIPAFFAAFLALAFTAVTVKAVEKVAVAGTATNSVASHEAKYRVVIDVSSIPTIAFLKPDGTPVASVNGFVPAGQMTAALRDAPARAFPKK